MARWPRNSTCLAPFPGVARIRPASFTCILQDFDSGHIAFRGNRIGRLPPASLTAPDQPWVWTMLAVIPRREINERNNMRNNPLYGASAVAPIGNWLHRRLATGVRHAHKTALMSLCLAVPILTSIAGLARAQDGDASATVTNAPQPRAGGVINQSGSVGLGPLLGEPMGLSAKLWLTDKTAVDAGAAWSFVDPDGFQLHGDFLFHKFDLFHVDRGDLPLYFGVGGRVKFVEHGDNRAGLRFPVGISYLFPDSRLEGFAEVAPILDVAPSTRLEWNGGVGLRYYFW